MPAQTTNEFVITVEGLTHELRNDPYIFFLSVKKEDQNIMNRK